MVKHFGFASIRGKTKEALAHLSKVNNWTEEEATAYTGKAFDIWYKRSAFTWKIDTSFIEKYT